MSATFDQLIAGAIVQGPLFPEPVEIIATVSFGASLRLIDKGARTNQVYDPILDAGQLAQIDVLPKEEPFNGDPVGFRLGVATSGPSL